MKRHACTVMNQEHMGRRLGERWESAEPRLDFLSHLFRLKSSVVNTGTVGIQWTQAAIVSVLIKSNTVHQEERSSSVQALPYMVVVISKSQHVQQGSIGMDTDV